LVAGLEVALADVAVVFGVAVAVVGVVEVDAVGVDADVDAVAVVADVDAVDALPDVPANIFCAMVIAADTAEPCIVAEGAADAEGTEDAEAIMDAAEPVVVMFDGIYL